MTVILLFFALIVLAIVAFSWLWIVTIAYQSGHKGWSLACLLMPPLYLPYCLNHYRATQLPFWLANVGISFVGMVIGSVVIIAGSMN